MSRPHTAAHIIRDEHASLSAVLRTLMLLVGAQRRRDEPLPHDALRAMLFYIDEFPERLHHPKESQLLFPKIRRRSEEAGPLLDRLDADHARSAAAVRDLQHEATAIELLDDVPDARSRRSRFEEKLLDYVHAYLAHIRAEEAEVLPLAERVLSEQDWAELDEAFMANRDPLTRRDPDDGFRPLYRRILALLPSPLGFGPALEALRASATPIGTRMAVST